MVFNPGKVTFYKAGILFATGAYDEAGKKTGTWTTWYDNGRKRSAEMYKAGGYTGVSTFYNKSGTLNSDYTFNSTGKQTEERAYSIGGILTTVTTIKGEDKYINGYHPNGQKEYAIITRDKNIRDGHYQYFFDNGNVSNDFTISDGERNGISKEYYRNGRLKEEAVYKSGKRDGKYVNYHANGKMHYNTSYRNDKLDGPYEEWTDLGKLDEKGAYSRGNKTGTDSMYATDGRVYSTLSYDDNELVGYSFRDEEGKLINAAAKRKQDEPVTGYYPNGNKRSELTYKNGKTDGIVKYYYPTGSLRRTVTYKEGKQDGLTVDYYRSGSVSARAAYKEDVQDGYCQGYYTNGRLHTEGWMKGGAKAGVWHFYTPAGKPDRESYYLNDRLNGPSHDFLSNGKKDYTDIYDNGMIVGLIEYDTLGKVRRRQDFPQGNGIYAMTFLNGETRFSSPLQHGNYHGAFTNLLPGGTLAEKGFNANGERDSTLEDYDAAGALLVKSAYRNGNREGLVSYYLPNGAVTREMQYEGNEQEGPEKIWEEGMLRYTYNHHHDNLEGEKTIYGDDAQKVCVLHFEEDELIAYSAMGRDGKTSALIPVKNGTCTITAYYGNGKKAVEITYKESMQDGRQTLWYSNGQLASEHSNLKNYLEGPSRRWYADGRPAYEATYHEDELTGKEIVYNKDGKAITTISYLDGGVRHGPAVYDYPGAPKPVTLQYYYGYPLSRN